MFIYYNLDSFNLHNIALIDKVKNKTKNGYYYKINYNTEIYSLETVIIKIDLTDNSQLNKFNLLEKNILYKINIKKLNPTFNFNNFLNKCEKKEVYIKLCGLYSNNYNYGLIYKLINID